MGIVNNRSILEKLFLGSNCRLFDITFSILPIHIGGSKKLRSILAPYLEPYLESYLEPYLEHYLNPYLKPYLQVCCSEERDKIN